MKTYQTRPVEVQAIQWMGHGDNNKDVSKYECERGDAGAVKVFDMRYSPPETKTYCVILPRYWIIYQDGFPIDVQDDKAFNKNYGLKVISRS